MIFDKNVHIVELCTKGVVKKMFFTLSVREIPADSNLVNEIPDTAKDDLKSNVSEESPP